MGRLSPVATKESKLHLACKNEILKGLLESHPNGDWTLERPGFKANKEKGLSVVKPDVSGRIHGKGVIIETQVSYLNIKKVIHRTEQYSKRGAYILWVVPLVEDFGEDLFRPRLFERFLHTMYFGRVYYWKKGDGTLLTPVHFDDAERYIEPSSWFTPEGEEMSGGGYNKIYKTMKNPIIGQQVDICKEFGPQNRPLFEMENENLSVPACKIFSDKLRNSLH